MLKQWIQWKIDVEESVKYWKLIPCYYSNISFIWLKKTKQKDDMSGKSNMEFEHWAINPILPDWQIEPVLPNSHQSSERQLFPNWQTEPAQSNRQICIKWVITFSHLSTKSTWRCSHINEFDLITFTFYTVATLLPKICMDFKWARVCKTIFKAMKFCQAKNS